MGEIINEKTISQLKKLLNRKNKKNFEDLIILTDDREKNFNTKLLDRKDFLIGAEGFMFRKKDRLSNNFYRRVLLSLQIERNPNKFQKGFLDKIKNKKLDDKLQEISNFLNK